MGHMPGGPTSSSTAVLAPEEVGQHPWLPLGKWQSRCTTQDRPLAHPKPSTPEERSSQGLTATVIDRHEASPTVVSREGETRGVAARRKS